MKVVYYSLMKLSDGKIVFGSCDKSIKIGNPNEDFKCKRTLLGHEGCVYLLMKLIDDKSGSWDKSVKITIY